MSHPNATQLRVQPEVKLYIDAKFREHEQRLVQLTQGIDHKLAALSQLRTELEDSVRECQAKVAKMEDKLATDPSYTITKGLLIRVAKELDLEG